MTGNNRRDQIERKLEYVQEQMGSLAIRAGQSLGHGSDEADKANDLVERGGAMAMFQLLERQRWQLEHAEDRVNKGVGELCEVCGLPIDEDRLEALVEATRCLRCQQRVEHKIPMAAQIR